jgi:response regulator NasT
MITSLRIAVAEDEPELIADLEETLQELGHKVVIRVGDGAALLKEFQEIEVDLVITDIKMPVMDGLAAIEQIRSIRPVPVIILSAFHDEDFLNRALKEHVMAYLVKPIQTQTLQMSIELAMQRFREFLALQAEADNLKHALEDRKIIERAKGILMDRANLSEPDAFRRLQLLSSQKNKKMVEIAQTIVDAELAFRPE